MTTRSNGTSGAGFDDEIDVVVLPKITPPLVWCVCVSPKPAIMAYEVSHVGTRSDTNGAWPDVGVPTCASCGLPIRPVS